jgi:hypothetical protein
MDLPVCVKLLHKFCVQSYYEVMIKSKTKVALIFGLQADPFSLSPITVSARKVG